MHRPKKTKTLSDDMSIIQAPLVGGKRANPVSFDALRGARIYAKDLNCGDLIQVPDNAQIARGLGSKKIYPAHERVFYGYLDDPGSAFLTICLLDPRWADAAQAAAMEVSLTCDHDAACDFLKMVGEKWQLPKSHDGWFKVITPAFDRLDVSTPFDEVAA